MIGDYRDENLRSAWIARLYDFPGTTFACLLYLPSGKVARRCGSGVLFVFWYLCIILLVGRDEIVWSISRHLDFLIEWMEGGGEEDSSVGGVGGEGGEGGGATRTRLALCRVTSKYPSVEYGVV